MKTHLITNEVFHNIYQLYNHSYSFMGMCYIYYRCKVIGIGASSIVGCIVMGGIKVMLRGKSVVCILKRASKVCISPDEGWSKHSVGLDGKALSNEASQSICITLATLRICMSLAIPDKCIVLAIPSIAMAIHCNVLALVHISKDIRAVHNSVAIYNLGIHRSKV